MSEGVRCRLSRIPGETPKGVLDAALVMPALLGDIEIEEEAQHTEYSTVSAGQFSQGAQGGSTARMLRAITLEGLTLEWDASWLVEHGQDPETVRGALAAILRSKKPVELLLTLRPTDASASPELRMNVTFRTVKRVLKAGEGDTRYYTIGIKEWRDPTVERRGTKEGRKPGVKFPTTHPLKSTDTLNSLAHEYYGRYEFWRDIRDDNGISKKFGQNTHLIDLAKYKVGSKIKLPKIKVK